MPRQVGEVFGVAAAPQPVAPPVRIERRAVPRDTAAHVRMNLQHRAAINLQNHVLRAVRRFTVLVLADLASFGVMRALLRAVREHAVLGASIADSVARMLPAGMFNGWQYAAALFVALFVTGNYGRGDQRRDQRRLFFACAVATALPLWMTLWTRGLEPVLLQYGLTTVLVWFGLVAERRVIDGVVNWVRPVYRNAAATLFVGPAEECREAMKSPAFAVGGECRPVGFVDVHIPPANGALGHIADFPKVLQRAGAEVVVVCGYLTDARFGEVVDAALAAECQVLSVPRAIEVAGVQPNLVWRREQPVVELTAPSLKGWQLILKRVLDLAGAVVGLIILSPVFAVVAALVRLESPGPVFFTQARVGRGGRRFRIIKFRTMVNGAENHRADLLSRSVYPDARLFKVPDDPRITPLGRWLRRTSIDELPQLVNVLRGQMSLVGPRPPLPSEVALYEEHHYARFDVKPGITGPWQVAGRNRVTSFERVMALETNYIRNWSVWADLRLLVKTVPAVVRMQGAF